MWDSFCFPFITIWVPILTHPYLTVLYHHSTATNPLIHFLIINEQAKEKSERMQNKKVNEKLLMNFYCNCSLLIIFNWFIYCFIHWSQMKRVNERWTRIHWNGGRNRNEGSVPCQGNQPIGSKPLESINLGSSIRSFLLVRAVPYCSYCSFTFLT